MILTSLLLAEAGGRVQGKAAEEFGKMDPTGISMAIIAMTIVFTSLILLYLIFKYLAKLYGVDLKKIFKKKGTKADIVENTEDIPGETLAAISMALHLYQIQMQGLDDAIMTFKNASKNYSPWSSKIYGLRRTPNT
jgi:glutaconyl-CoA/methylmalonyl-CoA decarboxylase subunit delta